MSAANPDIAVPAPRRPGPRRPRVLSAGVLRRRLGLWLRELWLVGDALLTEMRTIAWREEHRGEPERPHLSLIYDRLQRAMLWMRALDARFRTEASAAAKARAAAKAAGSGRRAADAAGDDDDAGYDDEDDDYDADYDPRDERPEYLLRRRRMGVRMRQAAEFDCIAGKTVAEVMAQICDDLGFVATLLRKTEEARWLWAIDRIVPELIARAAVPAAVPLPDTG